MCLAKPLSENKRGFDFKINNLRSVEMQNWVQEGVLSLFKQKSLKVVQAGSTRAVK